MERIDSTGANPTPLIEEWRETVTALPPAPAPRSSELPRSGPVGTQVESYCEGNDFTFRHSPGSVQGEGTVAEQAKQGLLTAFLAVEAGLNQVSSGKLFDRENLKAMLGAMSPNPTDPGAPTTTADYESRVAAPPEAVYESFLADPGRFFGAAGLTLRPAPTRLEHGERLFLEEKGPPAVWAPVEVRLDPANRTIRLACLDGHPLRGFNEFRFESDGRGGTRIHQHSESQGSNAPMTWMGVNLLGLEKRQKHIWEQVHCELSKVRP